MGAAPVGIGNQLAFEVARVQPGKAWSKRAIPFAGKSMAGDTGISRPRSRSAQRNHLAAGGEAIRRRSGNRRTGADSGCCHQGEEKRARHTAKGTGAASRRFHDQGCKARQRELYLHDSLRLMLPALALVTGCAPAPEANTDMGPEAAARGKAAIERVGCASCHTITGIAWPEGKTAPALADGFDGRALIAGRLQNRPDLLARFVRNAPALVPETTMPAMPLTEREAYDVAAYLYRMER
jgi:mono/diheme cytochrome c family protein